VITTGATVNAYARSRRPLRHEIRNRAICRRIPRRRAMRCSGTP
jgi:hypothetical protein